MLQRSVQFLKKRAPPLGFSRKDYQSKLRSPGASKPWRGRSVAIGGGIEVTSSTDVLSDSGETVLGSLTSTGPLGARTPHVAPYAASQSAMKAQEDLLLALASPRPPSLPSIRPPEGGIVTGDDNTSVAVSTASESLLPGAGRHTLLYGGDTGVVRSAVPSVRGGPSASQGNALGTAPMTTLPFGKALDLNVEDVRTHEEGPVPLHLQHLTRTRKEVADSIMLPRHINTLFHKIMGWSEDLAELEAAQDSATAATSPPVLRKKMANLTERMKYGVLLDAYEKDKFCIEHQLEIAGDKIEKKFMEWEGIHVLDQDAREEMLSVRENKASLVMEAPSSFHVPVVNKDCCPGCGAMLQDRTEDEFGYVAQGEIEKFVGLRQQKARARHEYAHRMAELQAHWEKKGRQVGEEWLDFMTQEEFNAFYRDRREPFVCHRCHALENLGVTGRRKVWSAPDFTEKLRALKEKKCVVVLVVDITDFPGSMVYDLPGLISMNNNVIIAANKMDCVRPRSFKYDGKDRAVAATLVSERYVRRWVHDIALQFGLPQHQIKAVVPISAKRGWNMDALIAAIEDAANLHLRRPHAPLPTYFVGVANVGKSSVINAMAHHLYIPQPPHPESKKVYYTRPDSKTGEERVFWRWYTPPNVNQAEMIDIPSRHDKKASKLLTVSSLPGTTVAMNAVRVSPVARPRGGEAGEQIYFYDTPGLLPHWHSRSPLTLLQMRRTLIRKYRNPQCFILIPGHTLFLGGLAAVDVVKGPAQGLLMMVYTSQKVRNGIVRTESADEYWREQLGKMLEPPGSYEQLREGSDAAPALSEMRSYLFECYPRHRRRPKADVYVCGLGWVSFCASELSNVVLRVRTLPGVVHGIREPLRYNDLRAFRHWPKLRRRFTSKGMEDLEEEVDRDSINTVVRLVSGANSGDTFQSVSSMPGAASSGSSSAASITTRTVPKSFHPRHRSAASAPFESLLHDLQSTGKM